MNNIDIIGFAMNAIVFLLFFGVLASFLIAFHKSPYFVGALVFSTIYAFFIVYIIPLFS
ncbi:TPA: hypothetical protein SC633_001429 [Campylobacter fetus]|nr:hypothetical protein [Campylobacter fetus]